LRKPAGVGIGRKPPVYLNPGDIVSVSVTGLGTLANRIASPQSLNPTAAQMQTVSHLRMNNNGKVPDASFLTSINNKPLYYKRFGRSASKPDIVFVHGLGGSTEMFLPLIQTLKLEQKYSMHLFDLEGHGLSPTSPLSKISIESFAEDLNGVFEHANVPSDAIIIAHSMGCLIAAQFASRHPSKFGKLVLIHPPLAPLNEFERQVMLARADTARNRGMITIADEAVCNEMSRETKTSNPLAVAAVRMLLLGQDPEGYAKACTAFADAERLILKKDKMAVAIVVGRDSSLEPSWSLINDGTPVHNLRSVEHWHILEDLQGVAAATKKFLD
jgi:pimeloyl-ACP methyl ester carboxylesterase